METSREQSRIDHWCKGTLVVARTLSRTCLPGEIGVVLDVRPVQGGAYITLVFERGGFAALPIDEAEADLAQLPDRDTSVELLTYDPLSVWQVEDDYDSGLFVEAFALGRSSYAIARARRTANAVLVRSRRGAMHRVRGLDDAATS